MGEEEAKRTGGEERAKNNESSDKELDPFQLEESVPSSEKEYIAADHEVGETAGKPEDRDVALAQVEMEKRLALITAWEDNEKAIAHNKAFKRLSGIDAWENTKRASVEAQMKEFEEKIEKKKAEYRERMKNKMAIIHNAAEEKTAFIESDRQKDFLAAEEAASKFRATGGTPEKFFACFSWSFFS